MLYLKVVFLNVGNMDQREKSIKIIYIFNSIGHISSLGFASALKKFYSSDVYELSIG